MEFLPLKQNHSKLQPTFDEIKTNDSFSNNETEISEDESILWHLPEPDESVADHHVDRFLQTSLERENLQKKLFKINSLAQEFFEEQGYSDDWRWPG